MAVERKDMLSALYAATGVKTWKARVENRRVVIDDPATDLPEGTEITVVSVESIANALSPDGADILLHWWESDRGNALEVLALIRAESLMPPSS